jgi:DNA primase
VDAGDAGLIPSHTLAAIKATTDLQALAAEHVVVKKSGAQYLCLCPFHNDREPSCRIYREHYYCFSCQATGTAVDWLMHHEKVTFPEAARRLADRAGISLDEKPLPRKAFAYAVDEARFCQWWWRRQTDIVATSVQDALTEDDEEWLACLGRIADWMRALPAAEKFSVFRERRTEVERKRWREELACEEALKDWLFGLFDSHWRAGLGGRAVSR